MLHRSIPLVFAFASSLVAATGCVSTAKSDPNALPEVEVQDPDPEKDKGGPEFCNPTGKTGAELKKCYEHNEQIYGEFDAEAKKREPWFNFTPESWVTSRELDPKFIVNVTQEAEAVSKLEATPFVELSVAEAQHFTGKNLTFPGTKPYLLRGLMYFKDTGSFSVFEKDESVYVRHDSLGSSTPKETRSAVVVYLSFRPKTVYVDCQVAE